MKKAAVVSLLPKRASASSKHCSFCGKSEEEVDSLLAGSSVYICDGCVEACVGILEHGGAAKERAAKKEEKRISTTVFPCRLCGLPTPAPDLVPLPERGPICRECIEIVCTAAGERTE